MGGCGGGGGGGVGCLHTTLTLVELGPLSYSDSVDPAQWRERLQRHLALREVQYAVLFLDVIVFQNCGVRRRDTQGQYGSGCPFAGRGGTPAVTGKSTPTQKTTH